MFFILTFLRSFFPVHALGRCWLTGFLLSSMLCFFLVSSYMIDDSCQTYRGNNITEDIQRAINEVQDMATSAYVAGFAESGSYTRLMTVLFGASHARHGIVADYFATFSTLGPNNDFVIICDDRAVYWKIDTFHPSPDPMGVWVDSRYHWITGYNDYSPCDPIRKIGSPKFPLAFTINRRLIYLCPSVLDSPPGRSVAPYKDLALPGKWIDTLLCLPVILFHQLLHAVSHRKPSSSWWCSGADLVNMR